MYVLVWIKNGWKRHIGKILLKSKKVLDHVINSNKINIRKTIMYNTKYLKSTE